MRQIQMAGVWTALACVAFGATVEEMLTWRSPIPQPYAYVSGGFVTGAAPKASPDPLAGYRWNLPKTGDRLQVFVARPVKAEVVAGDAQNFTGLDTVGSTGSRLGVKGTGLIRLDFGSELPAWLEFESADLTGDVVCSISEFNVKSHMLRKTRKPVKYGTSWRLELNRELYEGVRFAFFEVKTFDKPFTIENVRAMVQVKPTNYTASFETDNDELNRIWYVGAWDVKANLREDCYGAILIDRGDRFSWTGDAYTTQYASLTAFSNWDAVLRNLAYTARHGNGIETYELYWIESVVDYYWFTGDAVGARSLLGEAYKRLDHADQIFDDPKHLRFVGWDERTGRGFDNPDIAPNKLTYQLLAIGAWKHFGDVLARIGEPARADLYRKLAAKRTQQVTARADFRKRLNLHTAADAINAGLVDDLASLVVPDFSDRLKRMPLSPFNACFVLQAMGRAGRYADAFGLVRDLWGGQVRFGGTCFFEVFEPEWGVLRGVNGPVPLNQCGATSLAHPWGAGVTGWLTAEMLGIRPTAPGFAQFAVKPHLWGAATCVKGTLNTPLGEIAAAFDLKRGVHTLTVPRYATATFAVPKEGMRITALTLNGRAAKGTREDADFVYFDNLGFGTYTVQATYAGTPRALPKEEYVYPIAAPKVDRTTQGDWTKKYGSEGRFIVGGGAEKGDLAELPDYVESITFDALTDRNRKFHRSVTLNCDDISLLPVSREPNAPRVTGCYFTGGCTMCPANIKLRAPRRYTLAVYVADCDARNRVQDLEVYDLETQDRIAPPTEIRDFRGGVYVVYELDRSVSIKAAAVRGDNGVINALFFGKCKE